MNKNTNNIYNGTDTYDELWNVLGDEAIGHAKYTLFAKQAEKEGRYDAAALFYRLANDELGHAEMWMNELGMAGNTLDNLNSSIIDENNDNINNYPYAADKAEKEGFDELSKKFLKTAEVEKRHENELSSLRDEIKDGTSGRSLIPKKRRCMNCGYTVISENVPDRCPLCGYTGGYLIETEDMS